jgi:pre-rRNA-processing protein TSR4
MFGSIEQVRPSYELDGTPLPFGSDSVFDRLFPAPKATSTFIGHDLSTTVAPKRVYSDTSIPACPRCKGKRVFECQLMPNLINATTADTKANKYATEEQRVEAVRASLQKGGAGRGMEWGTCFVFSCAADCCEGSGQFVEETVLVQWED